MSIKELRAQKKITQSKAAKLTGIPLRTYKEYENNPKKEDTPKYRYILSVLSAYEKITEEQGVLSQEEIREICADVFAKYPVNFAYLFGSYARGEAGDKSDVDLLVDTELSGLAFFDLIETLRESLMKKVDLLDLSQTEKNPELLHEILRDGVKIYERKEK